MPKRIMIQCSSTVNKDAIRRETVDGIEHIVVSSMTLPDNIVMNKGLYPADEIDKSFATLERTLAPVEHPQDENGNFISASDPQAIHNFHAGAFNVNVEKQGNRIKMDKFINVQEALKTDRGRRLLDRIHEIETNDDPRPIHTSTGVFLEVEVLGEMRTNEAGQEYDWIARNMTFDHDAILLDSVGAAQPHQGVGMAVNGKDEYEIQTYELKANEKEDKKNQSMNELQQKVFDALLDIGLGITWIEELFDEEVIFSTGEELFTVPYRVDNEVVTIVGIPVPVIRVVSFKPKQNSKGEAMKDMILNALKEAGIEVEGLTDDQLFEKYNEHLQANQDTGNEDSGNEVNNADVIASAVENAVKPLVDKLESVETKLNAQTDADLQKYADVVANSGKYPGLSADDAKLLGLEKVKEMAANCGSSIGVSPVMNVNQDEKYQASTDMPE